MKHYQVTLINPKEPNNCQTIELVEADSAVERTCSLIVLISPAIIAGFRMISVMPPSSVSFASSV